MAGSALILTLATLLGMVAGFAREWLLVHVWGAGSRTDTFLVATFLPEMLRTMLASGLLSSAAMPLLGQLRDSPLRQRWAVTQAWHGVILGLALAMLLALGAPVWVRLVGPGLSLAALNDASSSLRVLAWCVPGIVLQAWLAVFHMSAHRYAVSGLASLLFNLPPVLYMAVAGSATEPHTLGLAFIVGSLLMTVVLLPGAAACGWSWRGARPHWDDVVTLYQRLWPLLGSTAGSQMLPLIERMVASRFGPGAITLANLARKLVGLPVVALMSLGQVLLAHMSRALDDRLRLLRGGLAWASLISIPAALGLAFGAQALVRVALPHQVSNSVLPTLLALFAMSIVLGSWNALLARYFYACGDTRTPLFFELSGNAVNAVAAFALAPWLGLPALPVAATLGVLTTAALLIRRTGVLLKPRLALSSVGISFLLAVLAWRIYAPLAPASSWLQLLLAGLLTIITGAGLAALLRPWRGA